MEDERTRGAEQPRRRGEDAPVLVFGTGEGVHGAGARLEAFQPDPEQLANAAFLIELGTDQALLVPAADAHVLPRGEGGAELQERAAATTLALRRERDWMRRRLRMPDHLLGYADRLQQARTEADVYEALREVATPVVGAYTAAVYVGIMEAANAQFHPLADPALRLRLEPLPAEAARLLSEQRLVGAVEGEAEPDSAQASVADVLRAAEAAQLLATPVGEDALLIMLDRRRERVFTGEDRSLLEALVRQAEVTLRRIASERQVAELALTDPVTGLPTGRHLEVMLDHALYRARRGNPLTMLVVELELEGAGSAGDPDDAIRWLTSSFSSELRRTDIALRQDANRFLVLLDDTDAAGARLVGERIREYVGAMGRLHTGIAEFGPGQDTAERLVNAATRDLVAHGSSEPEA